MFYNHILNKEELRDSVNCIRTLLPQRTYPHRPKKKNNLSSNGGL